MRVAPALVIATLGAIGVAVLLVLLRVGTANVVGDVTPETLLPALLSIGLLCLVGLTATRHPTVAWLAVIGVLSIATIDLASLARALRPSVDLTGWHWLTIAVAMAAIMASAAAVAYATDRRRRLGRWVSIVGSIGVLVVLGAGVWAVANPNDPAAGLATGSPLGPVGLVTRSFLLVTLGAVGLGLLGDLRPAVDRARRRVAISGVAGHRSVLLRAVMDELAPGRSRARRAALAERSRIARDLHADVVPGLRRAVELAEGGGDIARLAALLRETLAEVEDLGAAEHAIQLDIGGLVPALEWLAERTQDRSDVRVTIDVVDGPPGIGGDPPSEVVAAAFRVAGLAFDNVVRHASASNVALTVEATSVAVHLALIDDGPGLSPDARSRAVVDGRRGLADMVSEAASCGATLDLGPGDGGRGTAVRFEWKRT